MVIDVFKYFNKNEQKQKLSRLNLSVHCGTQKFLTFYQDLWMRIEEINHAWIINEFLITNTLWIEVITWTRGMSFFNILNWTYTLCLFRCLFLFDVCVTLWIYCRVFVHFICTNIRHVSVVSVIHCLYTSVINIWLICLWYYSDLFVVPVSMFVDFVVSPVFPKQIDRFFRMDYLQNYMSVIPHRGKYIYSAYKCISLCVFHQVFYQVFYITL